MATAIKIVIKITHPDKPYLKPMWEERIFETQEECVNFRDTYVPFGCHEDGIVQQVTMRNCEGMWRASCNVCLLEPEVWVDGNGDVQSDDKEHTDDFLFKSKEDAKAWLETQNYDEEVYLVNKDVYFEEFKTVE